MQYGRLLGVDFDTESEVISVITTSLRNVGNSLVITIPQKILQEASLKKGDIVELSFNNGDIIMSPQKKKLKGEVYLESYYGKPINEIEAWDYENIDTGSPIGEEEW